MQYIGIGANRCASAEHWRVAAAAGLYLNSNNLQSKLYLRLPTVRRGLVRPTLPAGPLALDPARRPLAQPQLRLEVRIVKVVVRLALAVVGAPIAADLRGGETTEMLIMNQLIQQVSVDICKPS